MPSKNRILDKRNRYARASTRSSRYAAPSVTPTEFEHFLKLPKELQMIIWSSFELTPATIVQKISNVQGRLFHFGRGGGIPAVLHVCRDSREEFLDVETENAAIEAMNESRRKRHPIYKLHFRSRGRRSMGCFMSLEIDTLYPLVLETSTEPLFPGHLNPALLSRFRYLPRLGLTNGLKRLAIRWKMDENMNNAPVTIADLVQLGEFCPRLEILTIIIQDEYFTSSRTTEEQYEAEVNGKWGLRLGTGNKNPNAIIQANFAMTLSPSPSELSRKYPGRRFPQIKYRFEKQFEKAERISKQTLSPNSAVSAGAWNNRRLRPRVEHY